MCNLYSISKGQAAIRERFAIKHDRTGNLPPMPGIFPDYPAPIVRISEGERELTMARWGMPSPVFALKGRTTDPGVTNVRNVASPHWRRWLGVESRCIVPWTWFSEYETAAVGKKQPVWFAWRRVLFAAAPDDVESPVRKRPPQSQRVFDWRSKPDIDLC